MESGHMEHSGRETNLQHLHDEIRSFFTEMTGNIKLTTLNLAKEHVDARVLER